MFELLGALPAISTISSKSFLETGRLVNRRMDRRVLTNWSIAWHVPSPIFATAPPIGPLPTATTFMIVSPNGYGGVLSEGAFGGNDIDPRKTATDIWPIGRTATICSGITLEGSQCQRRDMSSLPHIRAFRFLILADRSKLSALLRPRPNPESPRAL